jgi:hypothetical protein
MRVAARVARFLVAAAAATGAPKQPRQIWAHLLACQDQQQQEQQMSKFCYLEIAERVGPASSKQQDKDKNRAEFSCCLIDGNYPGQVN